MQANKDSAFDNEQGLNNTREDIKKNNDIFDQRISDLKTKLSDLETELSNLRVSSTQDSLCDTLQKLIIDLKGDIGDVKDKVGTEANDVKDKVGTEAEGIKNKVESEVNDVKDKLDNVDREIANIINDATEIILKDTTLTAEGMVGLIEWLQSVNNFDAALDKVWERLLSEVDFFDLSEGIFNAECTEPDDLVAYRDNFTDNVLNILIQFAKWKDQCLLSIDKDLYDIDANFENNIDVALLETIQDEVKALDPKNNIEARIFLTFLCFAFPK